MSEVLPTDRRFTVDEYLDWAKAQPQGRFELVDGEIIAMASERVRHVRVKFLAAMALRDAIAKSGVPCEAFTDGITVRIDDWTAREPDALIHCGEISDDTVVSDNPIVVVEVISPSSERSDPTTKFSEYFSVPSIRHYLIVDPVKRLVIQHTRQDNGDILSRILNDGEMDLTPPGIKVAVGDMLPPPDDEAPGDEEPPA